MYGYNDIRSYMPVEPIRFTAYPLEKVMRRVKLQFLVAACVARQRKGQFKLSSAHINIQYLIDILQGYNSVLDKTSISDSC